VRNREGIDFDTGEQAMIPDAELNPEKGLLWVFEQRLASLTGWMSEEKMDALSDGTALTTFGLKVNELTNADWDTMNPSQLRDALVVDWEKVDPRQFAKAIHTIDPKAPPHAILALRTRPRTIAFQTREGGIGILQIMEITEAGFKVRFKLALSGATKQALGVPAATPGSRVQVLLSLENHTREMLRKNVGFDELSIMGSGLTGTVNGKTYHNVQAVMAHRCRLESFEEAEQGSMKKCWKATLFVPQGPASDGSNRELSQQRLDKLQEQGVRFWLDHHRDQSDIRPRPTPQTPEEMTPPILLQMRIAAPEGMLVAVADKRGLFDKSPSLKVPARLNLAPGKTHRLKITNIAGREGIELYPTVEIGPTTARTDAFLAHNAIPMQFTEEDFDQALIGNFVIKVIDLPDPEFPDLALTGVETLVNTRLDPGTDPIAEADRRGSILAVIRLGNKDAEFRGTTPSTATPVPTMPPRSANIVAAITKNIPAMSQLPAIILSTPTMIPAPAASCSPLPRSPLPSILGTVLRSTGGRESCNAIHQRPTSH